MGARQNSMRADPSLVSRMKRLPPNDVASYCIGRASCTHEANISVKSIDSIVAILWRCNSGCRLAIGQTRRVGANDLLAAGKSLQDFDLGRVAQAEDNRFAAKYAVF